MKKLLLSMAGLLVVIGLVACSNQQGTSSSEKTAQATRQSSTSSQGEKVTSLKGSSASPLVLYTDEELENARTVGDFKR